MLLTKIIEIEGLAINAKRKRVKNVRLYISQKDLQIHLTMPIFASEKFAVDFVKSKIDWLKKTLEKMQNTSLILKDLPNISKEEIETLKRIILELIPIWELRLGVSVKKWKLRKMTSQWGNCKIRTAEITFSTALARKSIRCIEYVVAHELAHLLIANHSAKFYMLIARHFPYWKEIRKELNKG